MVTGKLGRAWHRCMGGAWLVHGCAWVHGDGGAWMLCILLGFGKCMCVLPGLVKLDLGVGGGLV